MVSQTCLNLLVSSKMKFDPQRGSAKKFLVLAVRNALREVRAQYCPPGRTTRAKKKRADGNEEQPHVVLSLEEVDKWIADRRAKDKIIARCDANSLLELAPTRVAVALRKVHYVGDTLNEAAQDMNVSRFKLSREISTYILQMQHTVLLKGAADATHLRY
ncbi:MAG: hypothetical protein M3R15_31965 [Acidobacteriota bacterium]|nr:hypothetical protein [Acidobacteriota bacterium]